MSSDRVDGIKGFDAPRVAAPWENKNGITNYYAAPQPQKEINFLDEIKNHYYSPVEKSDTNYL